MKYSLDVRIGPVHLCGVLLLSFGLACVSPPSDKAANERCPVVDDRKRACPISRRPPRYPERAIRPGGEAVVLVSFSILEDGLTDDVAIAAILGHPEFGQAAIKAVKHWRYAPAIDAGVPVAQAKTRVIIPFTMGRDDPLRGAKKPFAQRFNRALADLRDGDAQSVREAVTDLERDLWPNLYEMSRLALLKALLAGIDGDLDRVVKLLDDSAVLSGRFIGPKLYLYAKGKAIRTLLLMDRYGDADRALDSLEEQLGDDVPQEFEQMRRGIERLRLSTEPFRIDGEISRDSGTDSRAVWSYSPLRRAFAINEFETGLIDEIVVSCEWHREVFPPNAGRIVVLPPSWGRCQVLIYGKAETEFKFVEHTPTD